MNAFESSLTQEILFGFETIYFKLNRRDLTFIQMQPNIRTKALIEDRMKKMFSFKQIMDRIEQREH